MMAQLGRTGVHYQIVDAVDGRDLDLSDTRLFDPTVDSSFRPGVFGCVLSHLRIYQKVLGDGIEVALVLEDDVVLPADLDALLDAIALHMKGAEVVLLNFHSKEARWMSKAGSIPLPSSRLLVQVVDKGPPWHSGPWSGAAYLITREACARMAEFVLPVRSRADWWAHFYQEGALDRVRCVMPMPVTNSVTLRSTKDNYRPVSLQTRVLEAVSNTKVPPLYQALALRRWWHLRRYSRNGRLTEFVEELPDGEPPTFMRRN